MRGEQGEGVFNADYDVAIIESDSTTEKSWSTLISKSTITSGVFHDGVDEAQGSVFAVDAVTIVDSVIRDDVVDIGENAMSSLEEDEDKKRRETTRT